MGKNKSYIIPFVGLPLGQHLFEYKIGNTFFEEIDQSEIKKGAIDLSLNLNRQSAMLLLHFAIKGTVSVPCDRCNEYFDLPIMSENDLGIKIGGSDESDDDDTITISANESEINIAEYIYEFIMLSLPIKRVHPDNKKGESTCDKEAIKIYNKYVKKEEDIKSIDPRWEKLKGLRFNN